MAFFKRKATGPSIAIAEMQADAADADWIPVYATRTSLAHLTDADVSAEEWFWLNALGAISAKTLRHDIPSEWLEWMSADAPCPVSTIAYRAAMKMMAD